MKICITCGEHKLISEFSKHRITKIPFDECKLCRHRSASQRYRNKISKDKILHERANAIARDKAKKTHRCAKVFCSKINAQRIIKLICPVCKTTFGVTRAAYNASLNYFGSPPKYCGKPCYWKSLTKSWREQSSYAQNIKRIRKKQKL